MIGCSGGGKSTLAQALSDKLDLPYISMDRQFFWLPGWRMRSQDEMRRLVGDAVAGERWIIDGSGKNSLDLRLPRADLVIWLQMARWLCLSRVVARRIRYAGRSRPDMADGCPERLDPEFLRYIWTFNRIQMLNIWMQIEKYGPQVLVFVIKMPRDVASLLAAVASEQNAQV